MKKIIPILTTAVVSLSLFSGISYSESKKNIEKNAIETVKMYALDGRTENVDKNDVEAWKKVGWYTMPVVTMYAPDGRAESVDKNDVEAWKKVGWYTVPVKTLYAPDGRISVVDKNDVDAWKKVGWFESLDEYYSLYVNSAGLSSETDYLVWVSKSEFKVRVYMGSQGNWKLANTFTCTIGKPSTPTCEGTYKYYQAQPMWDYGSYYVGPIMRFNGGYAIHSTLIYKNGTPKDNRVGMKLSLGCVRLQPQDINWMASYVPLRTTIHITG